ncbi:MAG: fibronectin type III domain-containing protein [Actinomycetota bacterium]|nr:fibronectin type III domain-containing protein [Actinomycetota bacterium]
MSVRLMVRASAAFLAMSVAMFEVALSPAAHAATGISYVQGSTFGTGTKVTSTQVPLTHAVGAGDLLVGWFSQYNATGNVTVSDSVNGAWTRSSALPFGSGGDNALYYRQNSAASPTGLTITVVGPAAAYLQGAVAEYTGVASVGALDQIAVAKGVSTSMISGPTAAVAAGDLVYSALVTGSSPGGVNAGSSQGLGYTARSSSGSGSAFEEDITTGAAGTQTGGATLKASSDWYAVVATFRPATAPPPQPPTAPTGLTQTSDTATQVGLSWLAATDNVPITSYTVYRNGVAVGSSPNTSYTDTAVAPATTYTFTVTAANGAGQTSPQSAPLSVNTPAAPPPPPPCSVTSLASGIATANATPGGGTVDMPSGCVYTLVAANNTTDGGNGLPVITGTVTLQGNGATVARSAASGTPHFRVIDVAPGASLTVNGLTISNGIADNGHDGGGAIYNHGTLVVTGDTFTSNSNPATTGTSGGAIQNSGRLTVTHCVFTGNVATEGGAVFNQNLAFINQSTFTNNAATVYGGGALLNAYGTTTVTASTFVSNSGPGGGVLDNDTTVNISDSTFYNNTGGTHGGGAIQNFGVINLTTSTLSGNTSPYGADIYNYGSSKLTVSSSVVADGRSGTNCGGTTIVDGGYNLDTAASCGFSAAKNSKINTDPQLQPLAANGGPTQTMALSPGSAATEAIPPSVAGCSGTTDQRGTTRPQGPGCDIGAYELLVTSSDTQPPTTPTGLQATSTNAGAVALSWTPARDNVGVAGYTVYRNGAVLGVMSGSTTTYTDTTAASSSVYTYAVDAYDAAGNRSPQSAPLLVTTTAAPPPSSHWVQGSAAGTGAKVTSLTIQLSAAVSGGDLLVGWFGQYDAAGQVQVSDNVNGAWQRAPASTTFANGGGDIALFYRPNAAAAPAGITVTISSTAATYLQGTAAEYTAIAPVNSLDQIVVARGSGSAVDSGATPPVSATELLFSGLMTGASPAGATANNGLVLHDHTGGFSVDDADTTVTTNGPQHASWTLQNTADWYTVAAVFHTAAGP